MNFAWAYLLFAHDPLQFQQGGIFSWGQNAKWKNPNASKANMYRESKLHKAEEISSEIKGDYK